MEKLPYFVIVKPGCTRFNIKVWHDFVNGRLGATAAGYYMCRSTLGVPKPLRFLVDVVEADRSYTGICIKARLAEKARLGMG